MQNVVIPFEMLQNMRFWWSRNFMKHGANIELRSSEVPTENDSNTMQTSIGNFDPGIEKIDPWSAQ